MINKNSFILHKKINKPINKPINIKKKLIVINEDSTYFDNNYYNNLNNLNNYNQYHIIDIFNSIILNINTFFTNIKNHLINLNHRNS